MSIHTDREISANHPDIDPDLDRLKALDGVPHTRIVKSLKLAPLSPCCPAGVDKDKTHRWPKAASRQKPSASSSHPNIKASQNAGTNTIQNNLKKPDMDPKCKLCGLFDDTIDNLVSGCTSTVTARQLHTCTGRSAKSLALR